MTVCLCWRVKYLLWTVCEWEDWWCQRHGARRWIYWNGKGKLIALCLVGVLKECGLFCCTKGIFVLFICRRERGRWETAELFWATLIHTVSLICVSLLCSRQLESRNHFNTPQIQACTSHGVHFYFQLSDSTHVSTYGGWPGWADLGGLLHTKIIIIIIANIKQLHWSLRRHDREAKLPTCILCKLCIMWVTDQHYFSCNTLNLAGFLALFWLQNISQ